MGKTQVKNLPKRLIASTTNQEFSQQTAGLSESVAGHFTLTHFFLGWSSLAGYEPFCISRARFRSPKELGCCRF
jgi:hypothetical protein